MEHQWIIYLLKSYGCTTLAKNMQIVVRTDEDFENLIKYFKLSDITVPLQISKHILTSKGIPPCNYELKLKDIGELTISQIEFLYKNGGEIENIRLDGIQNAVFKPKEFFELKRFLNYITESAIMEKSDLKRFLKVYEVIGKKLSYRRNSTFKEAINQRTASCQGYSELLKLALNNMGIECNVISGTYKKRGNPEFDGHYWNQVRIEKVWYNCDLTWDSPKIKTGERIRYCLKDDDFFKKDAEHVPLRNKEIYPVPNEYNQNIINQYFINKSKTER